MTKKEIIQTLSDELDITKTDVEMMMNAIFAKITKGILTEGSVSLNKFGTFSLVERAARNGRNPKTGDPIKIPASKGIKFKVSKNLKEAANS